MVWFLLQMALDKKRVRTGVWVYALWRMMVDPESGGLQRCSYYRPAVALSSTGNSVCGRELPSTCLHCALASSLATRRIRTEIFLGSMYGHKSYGYATGLNVMHLQCLSHDMRMQCAYRGHDMDLVCAFAVVIGAACPFLPI